MTQTLVEQMLGCKDVHAFIATGDLEKPIIKKVYDTLNRAGIPYSEYLQRGKCQKLSLFGGLIPSIELHESTNYIFAIDVRDGKLVSGELMSGLQVWKPGRALTQKHEKHKHGNRLYLPDNLANDAVFLLQAQKEMTEFRSRGGEPGPAMKKALENYRFDPMRPAFVLNGIPNGYQLSMSSRT